MRRQRLTRARSVALVAALAALAAVLSIWRLSSFFHDDAFISLRYARHLAEDGALAWNLGERTEGYTNLLHVLASAALIRAGFDGIAAVHILNFTALGLLALMVWRLTALSGAGPAARAGAMTTLASAPAIAWAWGGLEAVPAAALAAAGLLAAAPLLAGRDRIWRSLLASVFFAAAYLTRPDTLVTNLAAGIGLLAFADLPRRRRAMHFVAIGAIPALVLAGHIAVREAWYGEWMPLTFYAKVGVPVGKRLVRGLEYVVAGGWMLPLLPVSLALALGLRDALPGPESARAFRALQFGATVLALPLAYVIWSGGDHMDYARILVPLIPALALSGAALLALCPAGWRRGVALALALLALGQAALRPWGRADNAAAAGAIVGQYIAGHWPAGQTIALATAGSTPWYADDNTYIDTLGLNDPVIAKRHPVPILTENQGLPGHGKGDGAYVLARRPDIILLGRAYGSDRDDPVFLTDHELLALPEFARCYRAEQVPLPPPSDLPFARLHPMPEPLVFTYFRRTCP